MSADGALKTLVGCEQLGRDPESALEVLRRNSADARVRAHFTEKRLRQMAKGWNEAAILREIERRRRSGAVRPHWERDR